MSDDSLPWLLPRTILLTVAGSRAYGTSRPDSDVDLKGVAVAPREYYLGAFNRFEQADKGSHAARYLHLLTPEEREAASRTKLEGPVFEVGKFIRNAADGNANVLEVVFSPDANIRLETPAGALIREHRQLFLSRALKHRLCGFAYAQAKRLRTSEGQDGVDMKHGYHVVRLLRMCREVLTRGELLIHRPDAEELREIRRGAWSYEQLMEWAEREQLEMDRLYEQSTLPRQANRAALDALTVRIVESML